MSSKAMVISAHASRAGSAKTSHVASAEPAHVASAETTTHVTSTEAAAHVSSAAETSATAAVSSPTTAARLGTRRKQRPGKQGACQYHHRSSSSHEIFLSDGTAISANLSPRIHMVVQLRIANGSRSRCDDAVSVNFLLCKR
jgi:hypothetical protein